MNFLKSLFGESSEVSMVRVMSFMVVCTACYLALSKGPDELGVIMALLGTGFGGKVAQKVIENSKSVSRPEDKPQD